jgi:hypothetical protein
MTRAPRCTPPVGPDGEVHTDLVPGDPPVPITVWRTPAGDDQSSIPTRLAQRLVSAYSRPGEVVVDLTNDHAFTAAATAGGRRHHRGWFTDAAAVVVAAATPAGTSGPPADSVRPVVAVRRRRRSGGEADAPELAAWFGEDLTDPDLRPAQRLSTVASAVDTVRGAASLVVGCWPLHPVDARHRDRLQGLLRSGVALLHQAGCLVLVARPPAAQELVPPEDFRPLIAAAGQAGLGYLQHIVAVRADLDGDQGDRFVYYATDLELLALARDAAQWRVAHLRVHADLLVFILRQTAASPGRGGTRG